MSTYQAYHSDLKIAARLGVLDPDLARNIPSSTLHRFRSSDYSNLLGSSVDLAESMRLVREFSQHQHAQAVFRAALRVQRCLVSCLATGRSVVRTLSRHKAKVVRLVDRVGGTLGQRRTLRMLGLSPNRLTRWRNSLSRCCPSSPLGLCLRTHPQQLSGTEVRAIKEVMVDERYRGWPLVSIYWRAIRDGLFGFALSTFYLYVKRLGLGPHRVPSRRKDHQTGIRATRPNEIWHAG